MFYRRDRPGLPAYTVLLVILWLLLAAYIITHPDPIGVIILAVIGVFIAGPMLFVAFGVWRARHAPTDERLLDTGDHATWNGDTGHNGHNGHIEHNGRYPAGAQGAQGEANELGEIPDEGGSNP